MPKVVFWSPEANMTGNTHSIVAIATVMGIKHKATCLILNGYLDQRKIESSYTPYTELKENGALTSANIGIGALSRLVISNKLSADAIKNYAKPVLKDRLDILYGMGTQEKEQYLQTVNNFPYIISKAAEIYDLVFVDLPKTSQSKYIIDTINDADIVICVVNQDIIKLEGFFTRIQEDLKGKQVIYVMGDYEANSKYNLANIRRRFRIQDPIYCVPHNYFFSDACNDGNIIDFLYRNINADKNDYNGKFIREVGLITDAILDKLKIRDV